MEFVWDAAKAISNESKHGVSFTEARAAFDDPAALYGVDDEHSWDEQRMKLIGATSTKLLVVIYVEIVENTARLISARLAAKDEKKQYEKGE